MTLINHKLTKVLYSKLEIDWKQKNVKPIDITKEVLMCRLKYIGDNCMYGTRSILYANLVQHYCQNSKMTRER